MARIGFAVALIVALSTPVLAQYGSQTPEKPLTATPSLLGPTGVIVTPTTEIAGRTYGVAAHWVEETFNTIAKANFSPLNQLEVGAAWIDYNDPALKSRTVFSLKYRICPEEKKTPAVAVGVWDVTDQVDVTPYAVISKTFGTEVPVIINLGGAAGDDIMDGFFANMTIRLHKAVDAMVEWDTEEANFGVRIRPLKGVTIDLLSVDNGTDREFGAGGSYMTTF
jgi:hypothetical protein